MYRHPIRIKTARRTACLWGRLFILTIACWVTTPATGQGTAAPDLASRSGQDWPDFLGPQRNNKSSAVGLSVNSKQLKLPVRWSTKLGAGYAACAVSRGRCFVFDRIQDEARLRCLHSEAGSQLWEYRFATDFEDMLGYNNGPRCTPVVDDGRVYVYGAEGQLHCVSVVDGSKIWQRDISDDFDVVQNFFGVGSTPLVFNDLILVMAGGSPPASHAVPPGQLDRVSSNGSALVALDKHTGKTVYTTGDDLASYASLQLAKINEQPTGVMFARSGLWTFEPQKGSLGLFMPWRAKKLESVNASTPVIVGREVFVTESYEPGGAVLRVEDEKFEVLWKDQPSSRDQSFAAHWMTPIFHDGHLYGCSGQRPREANLRCIEWSTGKVKWTKAGTGRVSILYVDGHFLSLSEDGEMKIIAADPTDYREVCEVQLDLKNADDGKGSAVLDYPAWAAPVLARGLLYVRGESHLICAELMKE